MGVTVMTLYQLPILQVFELEVEGFEWEGSIIRFQKARLSAMAQVALLSIQPLLFLLLFRSKQEISQGFHLRPSPPIFFQPASSFTSGLAGHSGFPGNLSFSGKFSVQSNFLVVGGSPSLWAIWLRCFCLEGFPQTATAFGPKKGLPTSLASCNIFSDYPPIILAQYQHFTNRTNHNHNHTYT